jgi:hypothetical protein
MYEQIVMLLSFVFAIAMTHLLATATELVLARDRVVFSGLMVLWMTNALLILLINWLGTYSLSTVRHWTVADIVLNFAQAGVQYFTCSLLAMRVPEHGVVDMPAFFARQRRVLMATFVCMCPLAMISNYLYAQPGLPAAVWIQQDIFILIAQLPLALAAFARPLWLQRLAGFAILAFDLFFLAQYTPTG